MPLSVLRQRLQVIGFLTKESKDYNIICSKALDIMALHGWSKDVSFYDILNIVPDYYPDYRFTIIMPGFYAHHDKTVAGPDYVLETRDNQVQLTFACEKKTLYIVYDVVTKHYGLVRHPIHVLRLHHKNSTKFCHICVTAFSPYKKCECREDLNLRKRKLTPKDKCTFCHKVTCTGQGCSRNCQFCGAKFKKGYNRDAGEGHRCIVYEQPAIETFWQKGDPEDERNPKVKVWVYDIECSAQATEEKTLDFKTDGDGFQVDENAQVVLFESQVSLHKPNLLVFRNVFDDDSSEQILYGENCITVFLDFLLNANKGHNLAIAHNGSGYDTRLIHEAALKHNQKLKLKVVRRGLKFMQLEVESIKFRDSYMFLPSSLSGLAKSFDLPLRKGTFPHMFNTLDNQDYVGPLPDRKFFDLRFMAKSKKDLTDFENWYTKRSEEVWDFKQELIAYCKDDVRILAMIVKRFHDICTEKFEHSPWSYITAPAYVHKVVIKQISQAMELPEDNEERKIVIQQTSDKWSVLTPSEYWFVRNCLRGGRTEARTLHYKLSTEDIEKGFQIKYVDVVSMYPAVQVKHQYPVGEPTVHIYDKTFYPCFKHQNPEKDNVFKNCACPFSARVNDRTNMDIVLHNEQPTVEEIRSMFGFICVSCIPNKHLYHPPLVSWDHASGKCIASLDEIVEGYFTTEEFLVALDLGYVVTKVHRIDAYKKADGLWNDFIKDLYIEKLSNSGPPPNETERRRIVEAYENAFGMGDAVSNSFTRWRYDGALRTVYKTLLNCGWGKHCQRPNMDQHIIVNADDTENHFMEDVQNGLFKATGVELLDNGYQIYTLKNTENTSVNCHQSYIPAGCYVPAYGRLTLFKELNRLGDRVLYHDTDSIIFIYKPDHYNIPENDLWGDWEEEKISKQKITEFVSLGPKSYGIKTAANETVIKLKGLSIKHAHKNIVNFEVLCDFIQNHVAGVQKTVDVPQYRFKYKIGEGIKTINFLKKLKFSAEHLKGDLVGMKIYPKGYCKKCIRGEPCQ